MLSISNILRYRNSSKLMFLMSTGHVLVKNEKGTGLMN